MVDAFIPYRLKVPSAPWILEEPHPAGATRAAGASSAELVVCALRPSVCGGHGDVPSLPRLELHAWSYFGAGCSNSARHHLGNRSPVRE